MANHKSAAKRARQAIRKTARNNQIESAVGTFEKKVEAALASKSKDAAEHLRTFTSKLMSAVSKGVIKKQTASRKVSRLSVRVAQLSK